MDNPSIHNALEAGSSRWKRWQKWLARLGGAIAGLNLVGTRLELSQYGELVDGYLFSVALCLLTLALARRRVLVCIVLLTGLLGLYLASRDHAQGLVYAKNRATWDTLGASTLPSARNKGAKEETEEETGSP